jgi:hypothetical protein
MSRVFSILSGGDGTIKRERKLSSEEMKLFFGSKNVEFSLVDSKGKEVQQPDVAQYERAVREPVREKEAPVNVQPHRIEPSALQGQQETADLPQAVAPVAASVVAATAAVAPAVAQHVSEPEVEVGADDDSLIEYASFADEVDGQEPEIAEVPDNLIDASSAFTAPAASSRLGSHFIHAAPVQPEFERAAIGELNGGQFDDMGMASITVPSENLVNADFSVEADDSDLGWMEHESPGMAVA